MRAQVGDHLVVEGRTDSQHKQQGEVVEVRGPGLRLFLKVVRPGLAEGLHERHRLLRAAGLPVPRSLGWTEDGLLVLEALVGRSLRAQLRAGAPAVDGDRVVGVVDRDAVLRAIAGEGEM